MFGVTFSFFYVAKVVLFPQKHNKSCRKSLLFNIFLHLCAGLKQKNTIFVGGNTKNNSKQRKENHYESI